MKGFKVLATAWVFGLAMTAAAQAADMPGSWLPDIKKPFYTDLISGWYFRGDAGYRMNSIGGVAAPPPDSITSWSMQNGWSVGFGGGYKYQWFRTDVTVDYGKRSEFSGNTATTLGFYSAQLDAITILGNVYLDLGNWGGFTPYIGAGAGGSFLRTYQFVAGPWTGIADAGQWNLTWAAMGGVSYQFSPSLLVDLSYRYLSLGDAASGVGPPGYAQRTIFRDLTAQEIRIGFRWMLD
jgi:opacity protein-like surface antigen